MIDYLSGEAGQKKHAGDSWGAWDFPATTLLTSGAGSIEQ
jgi:hypothetical protein